MASVKRVFLQNLLVFKNVLLFLGMHYKKFFHTNNLDQKIDEFAGFRLHEKRNYFL